MIPAAPVAAASTGYPQITLKFRYDYLGRRVEKLVIDSVSNRLISGRRFLYNGWNLLAEYSLNASLSTLTLVRSYTWGLDIARTLSEAGGVGALLQIADHPSGKTYFPAYDGNGNIVALVNSSTGTVAAAYEYSPYGEQLRADATDSVVADQPFRFSTKYTDSETGLVYYGRRYYDAGKGRFVGRDPIEEQGGLNLYGFCGNNGVNRWDYLGMNPVYEYGYDPATKTAVQFEVHQASAIFDFVFRGDGSRVDWSNMSDGDSRYLGRLQSEEGVASAYDFNLGWHEAVNGGSTNIPREALVQTISLSDARDLVAGGANVREGDTFTINTATGEVVGLNGQFTSNSAKVTVGLVVSLDNDGVGYSGPSSTVQRLSPEESAASAATLAARNQGSGNGDWAAIVNAGQDTFGNAVFQQPLTTLAKAGAGVVAITGAAYIVVGAAPTSATIATVAKAYQKVQRVQRSIAVVTAVSNAEPLKRAVVHTLQTRSTLVQTVVRSTPPVAPPPPP